MNNKQEKQLFNRLLELTGRKESDFTKQESYALQTSSTMQLRDYLEEDQKREVSSLSYNIERVCGKTSLYKEKHAPEINALIIIYRMMIQSAFLKSDKRSIYEILSEAGQYIEWIAESDRNITQNATSSEVIGLFHYKNMSYIHWDDHVVYKSISQYYDLIPLMHVTKLSKKDKNNLRKITIVPFRSTKVNIKIVKRSNYSFRVSKFLELFNIEKERNDEFIKLEEVFLDIENIFFRHYFKGRYHYRYYRLLSKYSTKYSYEVAKEINSLSDDFLCKIKKLSSLHIHTLHFVLDYLNAAIRSNYDNGQLLLSIMRAFNSRSQEEVENLCDFLITYLLEYNYSKPTVSIFAEVIENVEENQDLDMFIVFLMNGDNPKLSSVKLPDYRRKFKNLVAKDLPSWYDRREKQSKEKQEEE